MGIYVFVDGKTWGPLERIDVEESLEDGRLSAEHLAWHETREEWIPIPQLLADLPEEAAPVEEPVAAQAVQAAPAVSRPAGLRRGRRNNIEGIEYHGQVVQRGDGSHEMIPDRTGVRGNNDHKAGVIFLATIGVFLLIGAGLYFSGVFDSVLQDEESVVVKEEEQHKRVSNEWQRMHLAGISLEIPFRPKPFKLSLPEDVRAGLYNHEGFETTIGDVRVLLYTFQHRDEDFDPDAHRERMAKVLFERMGGAPGDLSLSSSARTISNQPTQEFTGDFRTSYGAPFRLLGATTNYGRDLHWIGVAYNQKNLKARPDAERVLGSLRLRAMEMEGRSQE